MRTKSELIRHLKDFGIEFETMESGRAWAVVAPVLAARIMGVGKDDENAFWVAPQLSTRGWGDGGNVGGQRTWLAPERGPEGFLFTLDGSTWSVPFDLDPGRYAPRPGSEGRRCYGSDLDLRTAAGDLRVLSVERSMGIEDGPRGMSAAMEISFRQRLVNRGRLPLARTTGLWSLIQLPCDRAGLVFFAARRPEVLAPYFGEVPALSSGHGGRVQWIRAAGGKRFKAGIAPSDFGGIIGFVRGSRTDGREIFILTSMRFDVDPRGTYVDGSPSRTPPASSGGDAAQIYGDEGTGPLAFCEIESHAPALDLASGESQSQDVHITIAKGSWSEIAAVMSEGLGVEPLSAEAAAILSRSS
jgi:hypothetical protein